MVLFHERPHNVQRDYVVSRQVCVTGCLWVVTVSSGTCFNYNDP